MDKIISKLKKEPALRKLSKFAKAQRRAEVYLVGGFIRDMLLGKGLELTGPATGRGRPRIDLDFALKRGAVKFAQGFSREVKGAFVLLDKERGCARVVCALKAGDYQIDFSDFRRDTLEQDLLHRDFSINAMALGLEQIKTARDISEILIDPHGGREDLASGRIKAVSESAFEEDPLRVLRAFGLSGRLDFQIEPQTIELIKGSIKGLGGVAGERIWEELSKILDSKISFERINQMDHIGILPEIFPQARTARGVEQGPYHHLEVWQHSLETLRQLELFLAQLPHSLPALERNLNQYLNQPLAAGRKRLCLLKLGALLHDLGKPVAKRIDEEDKIRFVGHEKIGAQMLEEISRRLKLSQKESHLLNALVLYHLRPGYLTEVPQITKRAVYRFFRDAGEDGIGVLILSLADKRATRGPLTTGEMVERHEKVTFKMIEDYFTAREVVRPAKLLTGKDIMRQLKIEPSPAVGRILREIEEAQAEGKIRTKKEALKFAQTLKT